MIREITNERTAALFQADPVAFIDQFDREPWKYQAKAIRAITDRYKRSGKFKRRIAVFSTPRQDGKTTLSAWLGLWRLICDPTGGDVVSVALDTKGARQLMFDARRIIGNSPKLMSLLEGELTKSWITLKDGREWIIRSADAEMSRGLRPSTVLFDELGWTADDGDLFNVLLAAQGAQANPLVVVTSTVGPVQAGPLWDLFEREKVRGQKVIRLLYSRKNQSPLVTKKFLKEQEALLPPSWYAREHRNTWGAGSDVFCTQANWLKAIEGGTPLLDSHRGTSYAFLDLSWAHDESVLSVAAERERRTAIISMDVFSPSKGKDVDFEAVETVLRTRISQFNIRRLEIESPQGVALSQKIERSIPGCNVTILHPTAKSNQERWGGLYNGLRDGLIWLPKDEKLRRQLLQLTILAGPTGWKVVEADRKLHQDRAYTCGGAYYLAKQARIGSGIHIGDPGKQILVEPDADIPNHILNDPRRLELHLQNERDVERRRQRAEKESEMSDIDAAFASDRGWSGG